MNDDADRALCAAVLDAVGVWLVGGGNLAAELGRVIGAANGDVLPSDPLARLVPTRKLDDLQRRGLAVELVRKNGRLQSGELARLSFCDPESARLTLSAMVRQRLLRRVGEKRASCYIPGAMFPSAE
jgi:hypothetical protein